MMFICHSRAGLIAGGVQLWTPQMSHAPKAFRPLHEEEEAVRLARSKSWTSKELAGVPLPQTFTAEPTQCATEASLAQFEPRQPTSERWGRLFPLPKWLWNDPRARDSLQSVESEAAEGGSLTQCVQSLGAAATKWRELPILKWGPAYSRSLLRADLLAGLTVGVVLIPQGVAYAMLAELPPIYGLYCSLIPLPVYALACSSMHMSIGPFALVSLLVADSVSTVVPPHDVDDYVSAVMLLSLMIGLLHLLMAMLNMGIIVRYISDPVLSGFTSAAAILISCSQLKHLLGFSIPRGSLPATLFYAVTHLHSTNVTAVLMAGGGIALLHYAKVLNKKYCPSVALPEQLLLLVLATFLVWCVGAHREDSPFSLPVVGEVPSGLPQPRMPALNMELMFDLLQPALVVGIFSFILSMSIVRTFAMKFAYETDSNQELVALGLANIVGSFFLSYPCAGSLSRSALVANACGKDCTPMHGVFTSALVLLVLLFLTPTFRPMPNAVLASIVFMAVKSLFDMQKPVYLYKVKRPDFYTWVIAFSFTLLFGVQMGIGIGVLSSMVAIVVQSARPNHVLLGRLPGTDIYRDVRRFKKAQHIPGTAIFRFDASLHFANKDYFLATVIQALKSAERRQRRDAMLPSGKETEGRPPRPPGAPPPSGTGRSVPSTSADEASPREEASVAYCHGLHADEQMSALIVDFSSINDVDVSALRMLQDLQRTCKERMLKLVFSGCKGPVRDFFSASGFMAQIGQDNVFAQLSEAVKFCARLHAVRTGKHVPGAASVTSSPAILPTSSLDDFEEEIAPVAESKRSVTRSRRKSREEAGEPCIPDEPKDPKPKIPSMTLEASVIQDSVEIRARSDTIESTEIDVAYPSLSAVEVLGTSAVSVDIGEVAPPPAPTATHTAEDAC